MPSVIDRNPLSGFDGHKEEAEEEGPSEAAAEKGPPLQHAEKPIKSQGKVPKWFAAGKR